MTEIASNICVEKNICSSLFLFHIDRPKIHRTENSVPLREQTNTHFKLSFLSHSSLLLLFCLCAFHPFSTCSFYVSFYTQSSSPNPDVAAACFFFVFVLISRRQRRTTTTTWQIRLRIWYEILIHTWRMTPSIVRCRQIVRWEGQIACMNERIALHTQRSLSARPSLYRVCSLYRAKHWCSPWINWTFFVWMNRTNRQTQRRCDESMDWTLHSTHIAHIFRMTSHIHFSVFVLDVMWWRRKKEHNETTRTSL